MLYFNINLDEDNMFTKLKIVIIYKNNHLIIVIPC